MSNPIESLLAGLTGGAAGGLPFDPTALLGGLGGGGLPVDPASLLGGLGGLGGTTAQAEDGGSASGSIDDGNGNSASGEISSNGGSASGLPALPELPGAGGLPALPGTDGLPGLDALGGLGGVGGGTGAAGGNGSVYGTDQGPIGGLLFTAENSTYGIPVLGENVGGLVGSQVEGGGTQNVLVTQLYGTPAFGPVQSLIGGNSYGEELVLYDVATRPVAFTEGIPVANQVTREVVTGSYAQATAFIGAYSGGLLSEDYLQFLVSEQGQLGAMANAAENGGRGIPGAGLLLDGDNLNSSLDLVTNGTDQILYVDDIVAGVGGGDALSNDLPFNNVLAATGLESTMAGVGAPVGDAFYGMAFTPLTTLTQEVVIAGPIANGFMGKFL